MRPTPDREDPEERKEWWQVAAEDHESAIAERTDPELEFERYEGPLDWPAWRSERRRSQQLIELGIERPELPAPYRQALGRRAADLERRIEDRLLRFAYSDVGRDELSAQAREFGAAARALNVGLSTRVAKLEEREAALFEELLEARREGAELDYAAELLGDGAEQDRVLVDAEANRAKVELLRSGKNEVDRELRALAGLEDHPDRWVEQHADRFVDALAAREQFRREQELAGASREAWPDAGQARDAADGPGPSVDQPTTMPTAPDAGLDWG